MREIKKSIRNYQYLVGQSMPIWIISELLARPFLKSFKLFAWTDRKTGCCSLGCTVSAQSCQARLWIPDSTIDKVTLKLQLKFINTFVSDIGDYHLMVILIWCDDTWARNLRCPCFSVHCRTTHLSWWFQQIQHHFDWHVRPTETRLADQTLRCGSILFRPPIFGMRNALSFRPIALQANDR